MIHANYYDEYPPDVDPVCPDCGNRLNVFGRCTNCDSQQATEEADDYQLSAWKVEEI